ncbi:hypothetical protein COCON_G00221460 [Conger conger]|uniref:Uncharacterized protein n=1 Tax=Conger conger TaxID=82655 RepID=A0A9Q1CW37_CONCO|nr:hypothetical protein COCON_G00221460 [Conger conger]
MRLGRGAVDWRNRRRDQPSLASDRRRRRERGKPSEKRLGVTSRAFLKVNNKPSRQKHSGHGASAQEGCRGEGEPIGLPITARVRLSHRREWEGEEPTRWARPPRPAAIMSDVTIVKEGWVQKRVKGGSDMMGFMRGSGSVWFGIWAGPCSGHVNGPVRERERNSPLLHVRLGLKFPPGPAGGPRPGRSAWRPRPSLGNRHGFVGLGLCPG